MYDPTGHMCVSLSNPNNPNWANPKKPTDAEKLHSYDAFFAYCRTYEVRDKEHRVIHRPEMGPGRITSVLIRTAISSWRAIA